MWGSLIAEIIKAVLPALVSVGGGIAQKALTPAPKMPEMPAPVAAPPQQVATGTGTAQPSPGVSGQGAISRPSSLNFTGGFTGLPPSGLGTTPPAPTGSGGFSLLNKTPNSGGGI